MPSDASDDESNIRQSLELSISPVWNINYSYITFCSSTTYKHTFIWPGRTIISHRTTGIIRARGTLAFNPKEYCRQGCCWGILYEDWLVLKFLMGPLCVGKAQRPINAPRPYILTDFQSVFATSSIHNTSACTDSDRNKEGFLISPFIPKRIIPHVHVRKVCDGVLFHKFLISPSLSMLLCNLN